jgi:uncharacterized protein YciI
MRVVMLYRPGPAHDPNQSPAQPGPLADHVSLMHRLADEGRMHLGGPFKNASGGMSVVDVDCLEEAEQIRDADSSVTTGFFTVEIWEWDTTDRRSK